MRLFVYESITGGGLLGQEGNPLDNRLFAEGQGMLSAVAEDFQRAGHEVVTLRDHRLPALELEVESLSVAEASQHDAAFEQLLSDTDACLLIAPETGGVLYRLASQAENRSPRLLSPSAEFIKLASDKWETEQRLHHHGVPTTESRLLAVGECLPAGLPLPLVTKPIDGVGADGVCLIAGRDSIPQAASKALLIQPYYTGLAVSVAVISDGDRFVPLEPCSQRFASQPAGHSNSSRYLGGELPLREQHASRARLLASQAMAAMPSYQGYAGVDLLLGQDESEDRVIEINPRLTTSYLGTRAATDDNLAELMLAAVQRQELKAPRFRREISFTTEGVVSDNTVELIGMPGH